MGFAVVFYFCGAATIGAVYCFATAHDFADDGVPVLAVVRSFHGGKYPKGVVTFTDRRGVARTATGELAGPLSAGDVIKIDYDRRHPDAIADPRLGLGDDYVFAWALAVVAGLIDAAGVWVVWRNLRHFRSLVWLGLLRLRG